MQNLADLITIDDALAEADYQLNNEDQKLLLRVI